MTRQEFAPVAALGLDAARLRLADSVTNQVWLAEDYVLKVSSGRFRRALWHERRVLTLARRHAGVRGGGLFPAVMRYGIYGQSEWLMMSRAEGQPLRHAWPALPAAEKATVLAQVAEALKWLHGIPAAGIEPPWLRDAIDQRDAGNIYHCPFEDCDTLLADIPADSLAGRCLPQISRFFQECRPAFADGRRVLTHGDIHFSNLMWSGGKITALLDFEGAQHAPADQELDTLLQQIWHPGRFGVRSDDPAETDRDAQVSALLNSYPALFSGEETNIRLAAYRMITWLNEIHHRLESRLRPVIFVPQISYGRNGRYHTYELPIDIAKPCPM